MVSVDTVNAVVTLSPDEREDLHTFLKDWLRHAGRTQADLRRALRAGSVRMPALLDALEHTYQQGGLTRLVHQLCAIEADWHSEDRVAVLSEFEHEPAGFSGSLEQLDLLLQEIRQDQEGSA
jgi:hypothetical protein